jgi:hypothetical protein
MTGDHRLKAFKDAADHHIPTAPIPMSLNFYSQIAESGRPVIFK